MDECKNRAAGSLEWKDGEGEREGFEKWAKRDGYDTKKDSLGEYTSIHTHITYESYQSRQPEIDALKEEVSLCHGTLESRERNIESVLAESARLKAENEKLRKAAERFINFFQDGVTSEPSIFEIMEFLQEHEDSLRAAMTAPDTKGE
jgi:bisphosphoglycerate-dependent phosphoglycerate mutase